VSFPNARAHSVIAGLRLEVLENVDRCRKSELALRLMILVRSMHYRCDIGAGSGSREATAGYRANASSVIADACVLLEQLPTENSVVIGKT